LSSDTLTQAEKQKIAEEEEAAERDREEKQRIKEELEKEEIAERDRQEKQRIKEEQEKEEIAERDRQEELLRLAVDQEAKVSNLSVNSLYTHFTDKQINSLFPIFLLVEGSEC
jgi:predicted acyl esterase